MIGTSRVGTCEKSSKGPRILSASLSWSAVMKPVWKHFFHSYILICTTLPIGFIQNIFSSTFKMFWALMCQSTCSSAYLLQRCGFQQWSWFPSKVPFLQMSPVVHFPEFHLEFWDSRSKSVVQFSVNQLFKFIIYVARNWRNVTSILSTDGYSHARTTHITPKSFSQYIIYFSDMFVSKLQHTEIAQRALGYQLVT